MEILALIGVGLVIVMAWFAHWVLWFFYHIHYFILGGFALYILWIVASTIYNGIGDNIIVEKIINFFHKEKDIENEECPLSSTGYHHWQLHPDKRYKGYMQCRCCYKVIKDNK